jgi:ribosomal protein S12 methylthiotransferase accessory factor
MGVIGAPRQADEALSRALRCAAACGVTRLADVTGLDNLGVPVFQAVRPMGRTLSVHQGKALTARGAMIGALMEAVETDHAQGFSGESWTGPFAALPAGERAASLDDFAATRAVAPPADAPLAWVAAERVGGGGRLWVPRDFAVLDFTCRPAPGLECSSHGLAARFDRPGAVMKALMELIERDARQAWLALSPARRTRDIIESATIPYAWFTALAERIARAGVELSLYLLPAVVAMPVIVAELHEPQAGSCLRRTALGVGCEPSPEAALQAAVTEAAQSRLTAISGVRDDILYPEAAGAEAGAFGLALPVPPHIEPLDWRRLDRSFAAPASPEALAAALAAAGFAQAAVVDLSRAGGEAVVVKAVVPGLGADGRARREPSVRLAA